MHEAATVLDIYASKPIDREWQRGDLVLVDGTKEGCVLSVNGNVAQVSMWAASAAVVNVSRLSPLEVTSELVVSELGVHNFAQVIEAIAPEFRGDPCIDATPNIRCTPEVGIVVESPDGPILTIDPLDGGDCPTVNIGDVVRWYEARKPVPSFLQSLAGHPEWHQRSHPDVRAALAAGHAHIITSLDSYLVTLGLSAAGKAALEASK